jgi:hypothetical protein
MLQPFDLLSFTALNLWYARKIRQVDLNDPKACMAFFVMSKKYGAAVLFLILASKGLLHLSRE